MYVEHHSVIEFQTFMFVSPLRFLEFWVQELDPVT
jgi:hypothetical protein